MWVQRALLSTYTTCSVHVLFSFVLEGCGNLTPGLVRDRQSYTNRLYPKPSSFISLCNDFHIIKPA